MLNVSAETKALLKSDSVYKEMTVVLTASNHTTYTYHNEDIYYESFELSESIIDGSDMTVMGCISSEMRITLRNVDNLKENAFDESPITVTMVPYETTRSKNLMPPLYGAGYSDTQNGITFVVNDDLSVTFTGTATANTTIELAHYRVLDAKNTYVSGCPSGTEGVKQGKFTLIRGAFETYYDDLGSDVYIQTQANDICSYAAYFASGQTVNMTFYPMMRLTTQSNTYEAYGEKYVARDQITLFTGYVDSGQYNNDRGWIKITAYDALYHHQSTKCWNWYKSAFYDETQDKNVAKGLRDLMRSLFTWLDQGGADGYFMDYNPNKTPIILEDVKIKKRLSNKEMTVTDFLKSLCQLNCGFGIVGRDGRFEIRYLNSTDSGMETITYYRSLTERDYVAIPFDEGITIITNSDDDGVTLAEATGEVPVPDWDDDEHDNYVITDDESHDVFTGRYFIVNNGLVKKLSPAKRLKILDIVLTNVQLPEFTIDGVTYPCYRFKSHKLECNGLPYLECGDVIIYKPDASTPAKPFVIVNRKLKGIQAMVDTFSLELPNTLKTYGGETSKKKDSNIESEGSVTNLTTGSFTENGTYSAYDYDAMGFSSVTVNVSGGGQNKYGYYLKWDVKANLPGSSRGCACVLKNDRLHLMFGTNYYYSDDDGDTWTAGTSLPHGFLNAAACVVFNDKIFCFGGTGSSYYQTVLIGDDNGGQSAMSWTTVQTGVNCTRYQSSSPYAYGGIACVYNNRIHIVALGFHYESSADGQSYYYRDTVTYDGVTYNTDLGRLVVYNNELHILGGHDGTRNHHFIYQSGSWVAQADLSFVVYNSAACVFDDILMVGKSAVLPTTDANSQFIAGVAAWIEEDNYFKQETLPFYTVVYGSSTRMYEASYPGNLIVKDGKLHFIGESSLAGATYNTHTVATKENLPTPA